MLSLVLSTPCLSTQSRMQAASLLLGAEITCINLQKPGKWTPKSDSWYILDSDIDELQKVLKWLLLQGVDVSRRVVRLIDAPWQSYWYHDLPVFASLVKPEDPLAASEVLLKLSQVKPIEMDRAETASVSKDVFAPEFVQSTAMQSAIRSLNCLVDLPVDTVLLGPTGAGKDTAARWLHDKSGVSGSFVHLNCAAVPEQLFEAELFGVKAGAFTGATQDRDGKLFQANHGTLYLDELDSLPLTSQAKLLTALQYRGAVPLGGKDFVFSEFRLLVSTKVDLSELIAQGKFREDLYYRLNVSQIRIPALNERLEDIIPLYEHFLAEAAKAYQRPKPDLDAQEEAHLIAGAWPGNIRELRAHAFRRVIGLDCQPTEGDQQAFDLKLAMEKFEKALINRSLIRHGGNVKSAARELGLTPQTVYYRLKCLGLSNRSEAGVIRQD